jgi:hypothetical protein
MRLDSAHKPGCEPSTFLTEIVWSACPKMPRAAGRQPVRSTRTDRVCGPALAQRR